MTLASTVPKEIKLGNGVTTSFSFTFIINNSSDLQITLTDSDGVETVLSEGTGTSNYSVSVSSYPGNGSITYPATLGDELASGETLTIARVVDLDQETDLKNQSQYKPETVESALDYARMVDLQQQEQINRSLKVPISDNSGADYTIPLPVANTVAGGVWNDDGTAIVTGPTANDISGAQGYATAAASSASDASDSADAAAASAVSASAEVGYAEEWANKAEDSLVSVAAGGDGSTEYSAKHWAAKAAASAAGTDVGDINALTGATITASDEIAFSDADDSNTNKKDTVQGILDLVSVGASQIESNAVTTAKIADSNVTTAKLADNAVTAAKLNVNGATDATITASDEILFGDVGDSNAVKKDTVQGILDLLGGGGFDLQVFTSGGTWNKPAGLQSALIICIGGGGGSGGGGSGTNGGTGGTTSFGSHVTAPGGRGGTSGSYYTIAVGSTGTGDVTIPGSLGLGGALSTFQNNPGGSAPLIGVFTALDAATGSAPVAGYAYGAGGCGAIGATLNDTGAGGGGGSLSMSRIAAGSLSSSETVTIGSGGVGATSDSPLGEEGGDGICLVLEFF